MSYTKQGFKDGQILKAEHLNHMENGIAKPPDWSEIINKPWYTEREAITITWDGDTTGLEKAIIDDPEGIISTMYEGYYRVSDFSDLRLDELMGCRNITMETVTSEGREVEGLPFDYYEDFLQAGVETYIMSGGNIIGFAVFMIISQDNYVFRSPEPDGDVSITFPKAGLYFVKSIASETETAHAHSVTFPERIVKCSPKYLPSYDWNADEFSYGHIKNRTHYIKSDYLAITWDGVINKDESIYIGTYNPDDTSTYTLYAYYISDRQLTASDLNDSEVTISISIGGLTMEEGKTSGNVGSATEDYILAEMCVVAHTDNVTITEEISDSESITFTLPKAGLYMIYYEVTASQNPDMAPGIIFPSKISSPEVVVPLDEKFIPSSIAKQTDLETLRTSLNNTITSQVTGLSNRIDNVYTKDDIDTMLGTNLTEVASLIGGDA